MARRTDRPAMTIAVDLGRKATIQTNKTSVDDYSVLSVALTLMK